MKRSVSTRLAGWFVLSLPVVFSALALAGTARTPVDAKSAGITAAKPVAVRRATKTTVAARSQAPPQTARRTKAPTMAKATAETPRSAGLADAGMVVGVDPETGELGLPTPDQRARLEALARSRRETASRPVAVRHADGSLSIDVRGRMREYSIVRTRADGRLVFGCLDDPAAVRRVLDPATPAPAAPEER